MTSAGETKSGLAEHAVRTAMLALERALVAPEGAVTAATETQVQTALHVLRGDRHQAALLADLEGVAASLRILAEAKRTGRPNLYASRLARLRRAHGAVRHACTS
jgi:hypothetical protein